MSKKVDGWDIALGLLGGAALIGTVATVASCDDDALAEYNAGVRRRNREREREAQHRREMEEQRRLERRARQRREARRQLAAQRLTRTLTPLVTLTDHSNADERVWMRRRIADLRDEERSLRRNYNFTESYRVQAERLQLERELLDL